MSKEAVDRMMQAASEDSALQQKLEAAEGFAQVVQIGAEKGYQFTEEELQSVLTERGMPSAESTEGELSEEALEAVAGGWFENLRIRFGDNPPIVIRQW
jgi:predicted ribosomally synthesized peptide with nif11-like leader